MRSLNDNQMAEYWRTKSLVEENHLVLGRSGLVQRLLGDLSNSEEAGDVMAIRHRGE